MFILRIIYKIIRKIIYICFCIYQFLEKQNLGYCGKNVTLHDVHGLNEKIFLYDDVYIYEGAKFIIGPEGKFIMKHHSGASQGLTVVTGSHGIKPGTYFKDTMLSRELDKESTVCVEEDARLGVNVTLMPGVTVGRGAQIGAGAVVTHDIPPYAVAVGVPARVIRFVFSPEDIIKHEKALYDENERLSLADIVEMQKRVCG